MYVCTVQREFTNKINATTAAYIYNFQSSQYKGHYIKTNIYHTTNFELFWYAPMIQYYLFYLFRICNIFTTTVIKTVVTVNQDYK